MQTFCTISTDKNTDRFHTKTCDMINIMNSRGFIKQNRTGEGGKLQLHAPIETLARVCKRRLDKSK